MTSEDHIKQLDKRMKEAGMISLTEMLENHPANKYIINADITDLKSFREWLHMRHKEMSKMQAEMILDNSNENDELFEWVTSHAAVFGEVIANFDSINNKKGICG